MNTRIQPGFPLELLSEPENFLSLLHYFGLLSIRDVQGMMPTLAIPNQTVKRLMYGYLRDAYRDVEVFSVNLFKYLKRSERLQRGEPKDEAGVAAAAREATAQLERYLADERLARQFPGVRFVGLIVVLHGWELVFCDAVRR